MDLYLIIVEGKNDRNRLRKLVPDSIPIIPTYGTPNGRRLDHLRHVARDRKVVLMTDADSAGKRIRQMLKEIFPDALDIYTKPGFNGVEHTPLEYLADRLRRLGILEMG